MISQPQVKTAFLAVVSIGISLVTVYSFVESQAANRPVATFNFPQRIPLDSWQQIDAKSISSPKKEINSKSEIVKSSQSYHYKQEKQNLQIEMHYIVGTRGNVNQYLKSYTNIPEEVFKARNIQQIESVGYHQLLATKERAYLSSCISPRSKSSVTQKHFSQNRYQADLKLSVWRDWFLGKASIRDRRCLWTHLSISLDDQSQTELAYSTLEQVWQDLYHWWLPRFPTP